jgi:hypothetical protein
VNQQRLKEFIDQHTELVPRQLKGRLPDIDIAEMRESSVRIQGISSPTACEICGHMLVNPQYFINLERGIIKCARTPRKCLNTSGDRSRPYK